MMKPPHQNVVSLVSEVYLIFPVDIWIKKGGGELIKCNIMGK